MKYLTFFIVFLIIFLFNNHGYREYKLKQRMIAAASSDLKTSLCKKYKAFKLFLKKYSVLKKIKNGVYSINDNKLLLISNKICPHIKGFVDHITIGIICAQNGEVIDLHVLATKENIPLALEVGNEYFLKHFRKYNPLKNPDKSFDVITGATYSSKCVIKTVKKSVRDILGKTPVKSKKMYATDQMGNPFYFVSFMALLVFISRNVSIVMFWKLFIVLGFGYHLINIKMILLSNANLEQVLNLFKVFAENTEQIIVLFAIILVSSIFFGRFYCGYLCPYGLFLDVIGKILSFLKFKPRSYQSKMSKILRFIHFLVFVLVSGFLYFKLTTFSKISYVDPISVTFTMNGDIVLLIFVGIISLISIVYPRFWCLSLCPVGFVM